MKQRSLKNQHRMLEVLLERFDAVDVTGMTAWERARAVHGRTAAGLGEGAGRPGQVHGAALPVGRSSGSGRASSPSSVAIPLFPEEEAA